MSTIKWLPTTAQLKNDSPGTIILGSPGSGKTFFLVNIAANALGMGQRVIAIDPKNDLGAIYNINPNIEVVDVNYIRPGALNPFEFLKKEKPDGSFEYPDSATITSIIQLLLGKLDKADEDALIPKVKDFVIRNKRNEHIDLLDFGNYLLSKSDVESRTMGQKLLLYADNKYGKLLFTYDTEAKPLVLSKDKSIIITLHGMELPDCSKRVEDYDANDRFTSTIIYIIASKLLDILQDNEKTPKVLICDEAHILFNNRQMASVINKFLTLGRSLNTATVLASQGISQFPKNIANYITSKFIFKSSIEEARQFLELFNTGALDASQSIDEDNIITAITQLPKGVCFFIDRKNRNGVIHIKSNYDEKLISSNPLTKKRVDENGNLVDREDIDEEE